jgi:hypothetical protein
VSSPLTPQQCDDIDTRWTSVPRQERPALTVTGSSSPGVLLAALAHAPEDVAALLATVRHLTERVAELERPTVEAKRNEIRESYAGLAAQCREDRDYEGAFDVECRLRKREEQWAAEDAAAAPASV